jgi:[ribosomal protein S18]-alanine N-acetyltransferase
MTPGEAVRFERWEAAERPYPWTARHFLETSTTAGVAVLEEEGAGIGFAVLQVVADEAYLLNLMIEPRFRRKGAGEALLQKVMIWARSAGASRLLLDVDPNNAPAVRLYTTCGFETLERRPHSYPQGEDALLMRKLL